MAICEWETISGCLFHLHTQKKKSLVQYIYTKKRLIIFFKQCDKPLKKKIPQNVFSLHNGL